MLLLGMLFSLSAAVYSMDRQEKTEKAIQQARKQFQKEMKRYRGCSMAPIELFLTFNQQVETIILDPSNETPNIMKLQHLYGDARWDLRKIVIRDMIEKEEVNPNKITYQNTTPLEEAKKFKDKKFIKYLQKKQ